MSISSEITRISNAKTAIAESIANKGVTVPSGTKIDGMAALIDSIQTGGGGAVQPSKALTVTSNGTTTITPDAPYDAIKQVDLTVNTKNVSSVTINCEANDSFAFWLSPNGVFYDKKLTMGANTITVAQYSPIGVYNDYGYTLNNLNNIVNSGGTMEIKIASTGTIGYFHIYYATAATASATQPTD